MQNEITNVPAPTEQESRQIALQHGVNVDSVIPPSFKSRLEELRSILQSTDVPFPVAPDVAQNYYQLAESGAPFGTGGLTDQTVELGKYTNQQVYDSLTLNDHLSWACLVADQQSSKHKYACDEYLSGESMFAISGNVIPDYWLLNARIYQQTGWQLATVSEIIPAETFFHCHSHKFFPVTTFMRPLGCDYLEEPDIGHDIAGHVATFTIPEVAQVMNNHGLANDIIRREKKQKLRTTSNRMEAERIEAEAVELLLYAGRLYWFTVEFGLVMQDGNMKAFGAGILSSPGETRYSIDSPESNRILINPRDDRDLLRLASTDYLISEFQKTYFVMKDFDSLTSLTPERILRTVRTAQRLPHHTWRELVPGDDVINVGKTMTAPNEKYYRLLAGQPLDNCLRRCAIRNLRMYSRGLDMSHVEEIEFVENLPALPDELLREFADADGHGKFEPES